MTGTSADLRLPADSAYVAAVRLTTAALTARLGFSIDDLEDARVAVSEACTLLLENQADSAAGDLLEIHYELDDQRLGVDISAPSYAEIDRASYAWQVLTAVTTDLHTEVVDGRRHISYQSKSATRSE